MRDKAILSTLDPQPTGTSDFPTLTNHSSENGETSDDTSCSTKTFKHSAAVKKVPLLPSTTILNSNEAPTTVCGHLQLLFAQLQYSFRRYVIV